LVAGCSWCSMRQNMDVNIHNILEPATFWCSYTCGPNYSHIADYRIN
jgi:hypothetical protein